MYELIQTTAQSYYILSPNRIGLWRRNDTEVYIIDSGNDKDAGKRVRKILDQNGWTLKGILITHAHADHIGGAAYLQQQYGCKVFLSGAEAGFAEHTFLQTSFLYGGYPLPELRHKFLTAAPCKVSPLTDSDFPQEIEIIPLPGHSFDMVGYRTPDGTAYLADCLSSAATLEKYHITVLYDIAAHLETLEKVSAMEATMFVPSHADAAAEVASLAALNCQKVEEIAAHILELCASPCSFESILQHLFADYQLQMTYEQHTLLSCTVRSYLSWLKQQGRLVSFFRDNIMLWQKNMD